MWKSILISCLLPVYAHAHMAACDVKFSPNGGIQAEVVKRIGAAKTNIDVLAYGYTSDAIGASLRAARASGVTVRIIVDKSVPNSLGSELQFDKEAGILTYVDKTYRIAHSKVMVIDSNTVITGSYNWSDSAERVNSENILFCNSKALAKEYSIRFEYLLTKAIAY